MKFIIMGPVSLILVIHAQTCDAVVRRRTRRQAAVRPLGVPGARAG